MSSSSSESPFPVSPEPLASADEAAFAAWVAAAYAEAPGPSPDAATRCAAAVRARVQQVQPPAPARWIRHPWWSGAAAAAALLLMVSMRADVRRGAATALGRRPVPAAEAGAPAPHAPPLTRFAVTLPPSAHSVTLVGDFNGWDPTATPMRREGGAGHWGTALPLPPGRHVYAFVVDGRDWRVDPLAPQVPDDGLGPANAVIVEGPR